MNKYENAIKQETNYEHYREEIDNYKHGNEDCIQCYVYLELMGNGICPENTGEYCCGGEECFVECVKWLSQSYQKQKIKLTQFEYDILCAFKVYSNSKFEHYPPLMQLKKKGYFQNINVEMTIEELLNCEVV